MAVEFTCDKCGKLLSVEAQPGDTVKCSHCHKKVVVPVALASLPRPLVPPNAGQPGTMMQPPMPPPPEMPPEERAPAMMGAMAVAMPWVISLFFHLGLAMIMLFLTMLVVETKVPTSVDVPDAVFSEEPGGKINPGEATGDPTRPARSDATVVQHGYSSREAAITGDRGTTNRRMDLIGVGGGSGTPGGGALAPPGIPGGGGGGAGPRSNFFGSGGNTHHAVYVIDRSGSMLDTFDAVRQEMLISISKLNDKEQDFHVIMFADGPPIEMGPKRLVMAEKVNKMEAADFLAKVRPEGQTDPIPALMRAFEVLDRADRSKSGKLIYLLTDGDFPDNEAVLKAIRERNKNKEVHIYTYLYGHRPPAAVEVLNKIAKENGGGDGCKYIGDE